MRRLMEPAVPLWRAIAWALAGVVHALSELLFLVAVFELLLGPWRLAGLIGAAVTFVLHEVSGALGRWLVPGTECFRTAWGRP